MKYLRSILIILLALPLVSFAPVPAPQTQQECSEQLARELRGPYLREVVSDARGIPIGEVAAWSCTGDVQATIAEFNRRKAAMTEGVAP
jgi:hypothetical protein